MIIMWIVYPDWNLYFFDFLLTKMRITNTRIIITINVITVVTTRPNIKPVLELPLVDDVDAEKVKYKTYW